MIIDGCLENWVGMRWMLDRKAGDREGDEVEGMCER